MLGVRGSRPAGPEPRTRGLTESAHRAVAYNPGWSERFGITVWAGAELETLRVVARRRAATLARRVRAGHPAQRARGGWTSGAQCAPGWPGGDPPVLFMPERAPGVP